MNKIISFVVPVFNEEKTVLTCIESILSQEIPQDWSKEIVVVDNGSTDNTAEVLNQYKNEIKYIFEKLPGPGIARNTGIENSSGDLIAFIDSDVKLLENWALRSMSKMAEFDYAGGQGRTTPTGNRFLDKHRRALSEIHTEQKHNYLYSIKSSILTPAINSSACIYRRAWLVAVGGFNPDLKRLEDRDLTTRIFIKGGVLCETEAKAEVYFSGNIYNYLKRYYYSGKAFSLSIMSELPSKSIMAKQKVVSKDVSIVIAFAGQRLFILGTKNKDKLAHNYKATKSTFIASMLLSRTGHQISPYLRFIEFDQLLFIVNIKNLKSLYIDGITMKQLGKAHIEKLQSLI